MHEAFLQTTNHFLDWNLTRIKRCLDELSEAQIWQRPNANSLSVGNQVLHLCGNIRQWILTAMGGAPDTRQRDAEFSAQGGIAKAELASMITTVIEDSMRVVEGLSPTDLERERNVQAYLHDGIFILTHVTEHLSYHTGQIIFWTKALRNVDLDFYGADDLGKTN